MLMQWFEESIARYQFLILFCFFHNFPPLVNSYYFTELKLWNQTDSARFKFKLFLDELDNLGQVNLIILHLSLMKN